MPEEQEISRSEELLAKVMSGEKLDTDQRRDVIMFLMGTRPDMTNTDHARLFGMSEGMIRKDKLAIRAKAAEELSGEDVGLVISDIKRTYDRFVNDINKGIKANDPGTKVYLDYQKALVDYQLKLVEALQSLGFYPKNLGVLQKNNFVFKSVVAKDGSIDTRAVEGKTIEGHRAMTKSLPAPPVVDEEEEAKRNALRDEFSDTPVDMRDTSPEEYSDGA